MDKDLNDSDLQANQEGDNGKSLVGKFRKNVSEIISNTPLSKWFRKQNDATPTSIIRRRQDDSEDEEDLQEFQPPTKRTKLPSTKETLSLNVSEVLSPISSLNNVKKPLYRNFPEPIAGPSGYQTRKMLSSTSIMSESSLRSTKTGEAGSESVFKNPKSMAGSTDLTNKEGQSDSEESTSGYSSGRVGSKEIVSQESSKQTSPLESSPRKNRSLFLGSNAGRLFTSDRSTSPNRNSSLSSRMPSFNPSTFGSTSFVDRTLSTKRILSSPFYNGHTIYGGASAYGRNTRRAPQDIHKVLRQSVKIQPVNTGFEKGNMQLGKTARRILDTLEQYSSPVSDAKKIPVASKKHKSEGSLTRYIGANPYMVRETRSASNRELQVPSVTDVLKHKIDQHKTRLQDSTEAARNIATRSNSVLNNESYHIPVQKEQEKHTSKMKTKISSVRQRVQVEEKVVEFKLNPVSLQIKELPKFDVVIPPPVSATSTIFNTVAPVQKPLATSTMSNIIPSTQKSLETPIASNIKINEPVSGSLLFKSVDTRKEKSVDSRKESVSIFKENGSLGKNDLEFKFSSPLVLAEYLNPLKALNNFKFSEPLVVKKRRSIHPELDGQENKKVETNKIKKNNGESISGGFKAPGNTAESMMEKFKPKEGTWECSVCMIRNQSDKAKCAACETPKSKSKITSEPIPAFGAPITLKPAENTWECPTCMIRNKEDLLKCAACEEKKPGKSNGVTKGIVAPSSSKPTYAVSIPSGTPTTFNFGTKFTTPSNTWECPTCMIRNKDELGKCAACETPKLVSKGQTDQSASATPAVFGKTFQKKEDEWDCQVCMVRNKATAEKCQCCESLNPSKPSSASASPPKVSSFNFGVDKNTATGFTFGIPPATQSTQNTPKTNAASVFGEKREDASAKSAGSTFTFGVPSKDAKETDAKKDVAKPTAQAVSPKATASFTLGAGPKTGDATPIKSTSSSTFGTPSKPSDATPSKSTPSFTFGTPSKPAEATPSKSTPAFNVGGDSKGEDAGKASATPTFSFGVAAKKSEGAEQKTATPTFSFGTPSKATEGAALGTGTPSFSFSSGNKTEANKASVMKINPLLKASEKLPEKATAAPMGFSFGVPKASSPAPVSSTTSATPSMPIIGSSSPNKRSKPADSESTPQAKIPTFSFKTPNTNGDIGKMASPFSKPAEESKLAAASPVGGFSFNLGAGKTTVTSATVAPTFGSTVSQADSSKPAATMFKFGTSSEPSKPANGFTFGSPSTTFGSKTTANTAEAKPFAFGSSAAPTQTPAAPSFGAASPKSSMFSFGSSTTENKPASFSFNTPSAENKVATPQFSSFASTTPKTQPPSFGFNQSPAPSFAFGGNQNQKAESGFGVASTTTMNSFGAAANSKPEAVFGAAPNQSSSLNGAFNFGAPATTNHKAGFSFGASSGTGESGATQSGFSFGSAAPNASAPTAPGGFSFSGPAPSFDATSKPTFNFTGGAGITAFSAPPAQDTGAPQRKIKKAIRRTVR